MNIEISNIDIDTRLVIERSIKEKASFTVLGKVFCLHEYTPSVGLRGPIIVGGFKFSVTEKTSGKKVTDTNSQNISLLEKEVAKKAFDLQRIQTEKEMIDFLEKTPKIYRHGGILSMYLNSIL